MMKVIHAAMGLLLIYLDIECEVTLSNICVVSPVQVPRLYWFMTAIYHAGFYASFSPFNIKSSKITAIKDSEGSFWTV